MVKSSADRILASPEAAAAAERKFKGVRKRKWGRYVCEIRLPNSRERIWLGSYDTAEKAARAFDAALFCLRGRTAKFNFPDSPPEIPNGRSMNPAEIQAAAARFAHSDHGSCRAEESYSQSDCLSGSPCPSVSGGAANRDFEIPNIALDNNNNNDNQFPDPFFDLVPEDYVADFGGFPEFHDFGNFAGDFLVPALPTGDYWPEDAEESFSTESSSFLWNF